MAGEYQSTDESVSKKVINFIQDIWPSIYKTIDDILSGIIGFIKDTVSGLWR